MALTYPITPLPKKLWKEWTEWKDQPFYPPPVVSKEVCEQNVKYYTELLKEKKFELEEKHNALTKEISNLTTFAKTTNKNDLLKLLKKLDLDIETLNTEITELKKQLKIVTDRISRIQFQLDFTKFDEKSPLLIEQMNQITELRREETKILNELYKKQNTLSSVMKKRDILFKLLLSKKLNSISTVSTSVESSFIDDKQNEFDTLVRSFIAVEKNILDAKDKLTECQDKLTEWKDKSKEGIKRKKSRRRYLK